MNMVIKIFNNDVIKKKRIYLSNEYYNPIKNFYPEIKKIKKNDIDKTILFYAKNEHANNNAIEVEIESNFGRNHDSI